MDRHGRPPRLAGWDYSRSGVYFVTLSARDWHPWFRVGADPRGALTSAGAVIHHVWSRLPNQFSRVQLDEIVVMPEHVHAVIVLRSTSAPAVPLGEVVRYWKGVSRTTIKAEHPAFRWKTGFYDRIVRSTMALELVRGYIRRNPENYTGP